MCTFSAELLLELRYKAASLADFFDDPAQSNNAMKLAMEIDDARLLHEDLTGCKCWYRAVWRMDLEMLGARPRWHFDKSTASEALANIRQQIRDAGVQPLKPKKQWAEILKEEFAAWEREANAPPDEYRHKGV